MPVLPKFPRSQAPSLEADPLRYLRGVLGFFLGGGAIVALILALTGLAPKALLLAGLLWTLLGILTGVVDLILEPLAEFLGGRFALLSGTRTATPDGIAGRFARAEQLADLVGDPALAAAELEALQRDADRLTPTDDIRLGLALTELYERRLGDPGRALGELRRLIDRYPDRRQSVQLRGRLAALRARHFSPTAA